MSGVLPGAVIGVQMGVDRIWPSQTIPGASCKSDVLQHHYCSRVDIASVADNVQAALAFCRLIMRLPLATSIRGDRLISVYIRL
jgi:hypothetical protein